jgi:hypothetical protein
VLRLSLSARVRLGLTLLVSVVTHLEYNQGGGKRFSAPLIDQTLRREGL